MGAGIFKSRRGFGFNNERAVRPSNTRIRDFLGDGGFTEVILKFIKEQKLNVTEGVLRDWNIFSGGGLFFFFRLFLLFPPLSRSPYCIGIRGAPLGIVSR